MTPSRLKAISTEIIEATAEDLKTYEIGFHSGTIKATNFCEYLKQIRGSKAQEVIADISGQVFSGLDLENIDLGNVIAGKRKMGSEQKERSTEFQECNLKKAQLRSNSSMEGLVFNRCTSMEGMVTEGDLKNVKFGIDSNITGIDLTRVYNIDKCIIDPKCIVANVKLGFPDRDTFELFMDYKNDIAETNSSLREENKLDFIPEAPTVERAEPPVVNPGIEISAGVIGRGVWQGAAAAVGLVSSAASAVFSSAKDFVTGSVTVGADKKPDEAELHKNSIKRIKESSTVFASDVKGHEIKKEDVAEWIQQNQPADGKDLSTEPMTLAEHIRAKYDVEDKKLSMNNLDLKGLIFSELTFGDIQISKCNFSHAIFNKANLNKISARDCNFDRATFNNVKASEADFTCGMFRGANIINGTDFSKSSFIDANFSSTQETGITNITESALDYADMRSARICDAKITSVTFNGSDMRNLTATGAELVNVQCNNANLSGAAFAHAKIENMKINNTSAYNLILEKAELKNVHFNRVTAQGINLKEAKAENVSIEKSDISYGDATEANLTRVTIKESQAIKLRAHSLNKEEVIASNAQHTAAQDQPRQETHRETDLTIHDFQSFKGLSIIDSDAHGSDFSGSFLAKTKLSNVNLSHAKLHNTVLTESLITESNLHGADLSGVGTDKTEFHSSRIEKCNVTDANLQNSKILGGSFRNNDISGANFSNSVIGKSGSVVNFADVKGDISTNLAGTTSVTGNPDASVEVGLFHGGSEKVTLDTLAAKSAANVEKTRDVLSNTGNAVAAEGRAWLDRLSGLMTDTAATLKKYKKSRLGLVVGIATGVVVGGLIAGYLAGTMGLGAIPLAIGAAVAVGGGAIGGGIIGNIRLPA